MKRNSITLILMLCLTLYGCSKDPERSLNRQIEAIKTERKPASEVVSVKSQADPAAQQIARTEVLYSDPAFTALSTAEFAWLKRNGFLTHEQLRHLFALGETELLNRSREKGDVAATTALGLLRLRNGDSRGAILALDRAARSGSLYAIEQLAFAELNDFQTDSLSRDSTSEDSALVQFVARMEQARIMGDHRVDYYINRVASGLDRNRYGNQILQQTTEYMRQMAEDSAIRGVPSHAPDARPNIDQWQQINTNQTGMTQAIIR